MSVYTCSVDGCERNISVSTRPGGNPVALENPEEWAFFHATCDQCGYFICDRCVKRRSTPVQEMTCPGCGGELEVPGREYNAQIMRDFGEKAWREKHYADLVDLFETMRLFGVNLTSAESKKLDYCSRH